MLPGRGPGARTRSHETPLQKPLLTPERRLIRSRLRCTGPHSPRDGEQGVPKRGFVWSVLEFVRFVADFLDLVVT